MCSLGGLWWICCYVCLGWFALRWWFGGVIWFADFGVDVLVWFDWFAWVFRFCFGCYVGWVWFECLVVGCLMFMIAVGLVRYDARGTCVWG